MIIRIAWTGSKVPPLNVRNQTIAEIRHLFVTGLEKPSDLCFHTVLDQAGEPIVGVYSSKTNQFVAYYTPEMCWVSYDDDDNEIRWPRKRYAKRRKVRKR